MTDLLPFFAGIEREELAERLKSWGQPAFRAQQIFDWVYAKRVSSWEAMSNLPADLQARLDATFSLNPLEQVRDVDSSDTTRKYLFRLRDGRYIESVLIPASPALYGESSDRFTLCVSSQVGCAFDCKFCASGLAGFTRNLDAGEIVGQVLGVEAASGEHINDVVFMGMGEPLANLPNVLRAIRVMNAPWGLNLGARHITVSTSGLAPQIEMLADFPLQIRLALSLHGATDEVRSQIMPINQRFPLDRLFTALQQWSAKKKQKITFEYILIDGVNDTASQARALVKRARSLQAKVNLIPYNTVQGLSWRRPPLGRQKEFLNLLREGGIPATLRLEKGHDINAACGQLRLIEEKSAAFPPA